MDRKHLLRGLEKLAVWAKKPDADGDKAVNIVFGCIDIMEQSYQNGLRRWFESHNARMRLLKDPSRTHMSQRCRAAMRQLIALTISSVEAVPFVTEYRPGALIAVIDEQKQPTKKQMANMKKARAKKVEMRRKEREARKRRLEYSGISDKES